MSRAAAAWQTTSQPAHPGHLQIQLQLHLLPVLALAPLLCGSLRRCGLRLCLQPLLRRRLLFSVAGCQELCHLLSRVAATSPIRRWRAASRAASSASRLACCASSARCSSASLAAVLCCSLSI